ncbi:T6SS immunity protein Tli4 family protein [Massilia sp.]|uniref:T6SS immunity protein Tli4 family protein n=1 Tax=Massilia sp. TaxID=1882437 RepID=UPI003919E49A
MTTLSSRLEPLFEKTRTVCFGRFVMHVPSTAVVVYGPAQVGTSIEYFAGQGDKVAEHLSARLAEVENERQFLLKTDIPRLPLFGKVIDGVRPGQKIVFGSKDQVGYAVHSFIPAGEDLFVQYIDSILPDNEIVTNFNAIASHLRPRAQDEIPAEPGSCIEGGFIPLEQEYERATVGIRLQEFPDVHISVDVHKNQEFLANRSSPSILREQARLAAEDAGLGAVFARAKILRQGALQLEGWKGEEMALVTPVYKDDKAVHEFRFHSAGAVHDSLQPELDIRLDSGVKDNRKASVNPSITDEEALALWDKLISTIRVRRPSDATATTAATRQTPLGSVARTGEICPQTGWWECTESKSTDRHAKRLLRAGEPVPHAQLDSKSGLWQRFFGERKRHMPAVWKLVGFDEQNV